jgi:hypothetical protein
MPFLILTWAFHCNFACILEVTQIESQTQKKGRTTQGQFFFSILEVTQIESQTQKKGRTTQGQFFFITHLDRVDNLLT